MLGNKIVKYALDDFAFSGGDLASGGQPIFLGVQNTIYSGSTANTPTNPNASYAADSGIYGGAISSGSGLPTSGRPPQIGRNSIYMPGFNNLDFRITRNIPIHDQVQLQIVGEAFNLLNHTVVTGVNSTYTTYLSSSATSSVCSSTAAAPSGSAVQGCFEPYTGVGINAFGVTNGTNNLLVGPRQLQISAKFTF